MRDNLAGVYDFLAQQVATAPLHKKKGSSKQKVRKKDGRIHMKCGENSLAKG